MTLKSLSTITVLATALTLALLAISLFSPSTSHAAKKGDGTTNEANFDVEVSDDPTFFWPSGTPDDLYAPGPACLGDTPGTSKNYSFLMPDDGDGNPCGIVQIYDENGSPVLELRDAVGFNVTHQKGWLTGVTIHGQDQTGPEGIYHEGEEALLTQAVAAPPAGGSATLHVHSQIPVHTTGRHLSGGKLREIVGFVSVGDIIYTPQE